MTTPTIVTVPCLSGAPWDLSSLTALRGYPLETLRLDDTHHSIEAHADDVLNRARRHGKFVLMGDSFGALVALAAAVRQPEGLEALILSGGFAKAVTTMATRTKMKAARFMPGPLYRTLVLPLHARSLHSRYDSEGAPAWSPAATERLFRENTPWRAYVNRIQAALAADYRDQLGKVTVPTLILTPEDDQLIGPEAARVLREGIPGAKEVVLPRTGHMFRLSHPALYGSTVRDFLAADTLMRAA